MRYFLSFTICLIVSVPLSPSKTAIAQELGLGPITKLNALPPSTMAPLQYFPDPSFRFGVGGTKTDLQAEVGINFFKSHFVETFSIVDYESLPEGGESYLSLIAGTTVSYPMMNLFSPGLSFGIGATDHQFEFQDQETLETKDASFLHGFTMMGPEFKVILASNFHLSLQKSFFRYFENKPRKPRSSRQSIKFTMLL